MKRDASPLSELDRFRSAHLDLVVITKEGLSVLYGNGDGSFAPSMDLPLGPGLQEGTVADVVIASEDSTGGTKDPARLAAEFARIASLPLEGNGERFSNRDHDRLLYGARR